MSEYFYNKDRNVTGVTPITNLSFSPKQGSSVSFSTTPFEFTNTNKYKTRMGSLNSLKAEYNLSFGLRETEAAQLIDYFESRSGVLPVSLVDSSSFYHPISGFADEFSFSATTNNSFDVGCKIMVDNRSCKTNWSGLSFLQSNLELWKTGESVRKYSVRYFDYDSSNRFNNYFYATQDHDSSIANAPFSTGSFWSQDLFFEHDMETSLSTSPDVGKVDFLGSFPLRIKDKNNIHAVENLTLSFRNAPTEKAKAVLHFLETKFGESRFVYQCPKILRPKVFYSPSWRHTWNYENSHNIEVEMVEDAVGLLNRGANPSLSLIQGGDWSYFNFSIQNESDLVVGAFQNEKKVFLNGANFHNWNNNLAHRVDFFSKVRSFEAVNQGLTYFQAGDASNIGSLNLSKNNILDIDLTSAKKIEFINLSQNSLNNLNLSNLSGVKSINFEKNNISSLNTTNLPSLTGYFGAENPISYSSISGTLDAFVNYGNYSGHFGAENSEIKKSSLGDVSILNWRKWEIKSNNISLPFEPERYSLVAAQYEQESITGISDGQSIFRWNDSFGNYNSSRIVVSDNARPVYLSEELNQRSSLSFNGNSFLLQTGNKSFSSSYGIFAVVKPESSGRMTVYSDRWNRGLTVSGNRLLSKANLTNNFFGELSGNSWNVVGLYSNGTSIMGAVNTLTPTTASKSSNNIVFPGCIGETYEFATGFGASFPFIGQISEVLITSGVSDFSKIMRNLGAKHGLDIT